MNKIKKFSLLVSILLSTSYLVSSADASPVLNHEETPVTSPENPLFDDPSSPSEESPFSKVPNPKYTPQVFDPKIRPKVLMSFDGGGVRALYTLKIIQAIEDKLQQPITEYCNFFAGTSTGSLVATLYGLGYATDQIMGIYEQHSDKIFSRSLMREIISFGGLRDEKYDNTYLVSLLKHVIGEDTKLTNIQSHLVIPAHNMSRGKAKVFSTFSAHRKEKSPTTNVKVAYATQASTAAPTYFQGVLYKENEMLTDGGTLANNPALTALHLYQAAFKNNETPLKIISIGTGKDPASLQEFNPDLGIASYAKRISSMCMNGVSERDHGLLKQSHQSHYVRLNGSLPQAIDLDAVGEEVFSDLKTAAATYVKENDQMVKQAAFLLSGDKKHLEDDVINP